MGFAQAQENASPRQLSARPRWLRVVLRIVLAAAMTVAGLNLWTGAPLLGLWVASQEARHRGLTMGTLFIFIAVMGGSMFLLFRALKWLDLRYGDVIGRKQGTRQPLPWLKSTSAERFPTKRPREPLTATERILVLVVVAAIGSFEVWFFFFARLSLPNQ